MAEEKRKFILEIEEVKPEYRGTVTDSLTGETKEFNSAGLQINFVATRFLNPSEVKTEPGAEKKEEE